jgi:hypothetical protein
VAASAVAAAHVSEAEGASVAVAASAADLLQVREGREGASVAVAASVSAAVHVREDTAGVSVAVAASVSDTEKEEGETSIQS